MKRKRRIIVLGGGIGGLATAFFLGAEEGVRVTLVEREPRHDVHSSGRSAEILRTAIDDPVTEELGLRTSALLRAPDSLGLISPRRLVDDRGLIVLTEPNSGAPWIQRHVERSEARALDEPLYQGLAPHFARNGTEAWFLPGGGHVDVPQLMTSLARAAAARGVQLIRTSGEAHPSLERGEISGVRVRGEMIPCDSLVIAAGAWSGPLGRALDADLPLRTTRRHMWVTGPMPSVSPDAPIVWNDVRGFYARPEPWAPSGATTGLAFSATDLDDFDWDEPEAAGQAPSTRSMDSIYSIDEQQRALALTAARMHFPNTGQDPRLVRAWRGFRDLTPDDRPVIGPDARVPGLFWCTGLGGHGMTVSLAAGQLSRDAIMGRPHPLAESCSPDRFQAAHR